MRKLTKNQTNLLSCLTNEFMQLKDICDKYAVIQAKSGYNPNGCVWKTEVSRTLQALIVKGRVEYKYRGLYKLKVIDEDTYLDT